MKKWICATSLLAFGCTRSEVSTSASIQEAVVLHAAPAAALESLHWQLSAGEIGNRCSAAQTQLQNEITSIENTTEPSFANTIERADRAFAAFTNQFQPLDFYRYVLKDPALQDAAKKCFEACENLRISISSRPEFYASVKRGVEAHPPQSDLQKRLLSDYNRIFEENGLMLAEEDRKKLLALKGQLIEIQSSFSQTLNDWNEKLDFSKKELEGLAPTLLADLESSKVPGKDYVLTLKYPHVYPALKQVKDEQVRKTIYEHFKNRGGLANSRRLEQALQIRLQIAKLLHYKSFAEYRLVDNMAKNPKTVSDFLKDLKLRLHKRTEREFANLLLLKRKDDPKAKDLAPWDVDYYENILLKEKYSVSHEEVKAYFPTTKTIEGMLDIYQKLLDVSFVALPDESVWNPDVKAFRVIDGQSKQVVGQFFMDLFPRDGKYGHAANFGLISGYEKEDGSYVLPISAIVANFTKPTKEQPGLLTHDEVTTLFHEFGHVMHHVLSRAKYGSHSGTSVKRDFVEAPSQMLENWAWEKSIIKSLTSHYQTGEAMPDALIDRLLRTRFFDKGISFTRQIFYASIDMAYHTLKSTVNLDAGKMYAKYFHDIYLLKSLEGTRPEASFDHLMGGYEAGYYGYLWSEVYASDMFTRFRDGGLLNPEIGRDYRRTVLEQGGSVDPQELVTRFLGRHSNNDAFLRLMEEDR